MEAITWAACLSPNIMSLVSDHVFDIKEIKFHVLGLPISSIRSKNAYFNHILNVPKIDPYLDYKLIACQMQENWYL